MSDEQDLVTIGELYRLTLAQNKTLDEIRADVRAQNGRVRRLEDDSLRMKTIWSAILIALGVSFDMLKHWLLGK